MLGAHEFKGVDVIPGRHGPFVGPPGLPVQLEIHGLFIIAESPVGGKLGNNTPGVGMDIDQGQMVVQDGTPEGTV